MPNDRSSRCFSSLLQVSPSHAICIYHLSIPTGNSFTFGRCKFTNEKTSQTSQHCALTVRIFYLTLFPARSLSFIHSRSKTSVYTHKHNWQHKRHTTHCDRLCSLRVSKIKLFSWSSSSSLLLLLFFSFFHWTVFVYSVVNEKNIYCIFQLFVSIHS